MIVNGALVRRGPALFFQGQLPTLLRFMPSTLTSVALDACGNLMPCGSDAPALARLGGQLTSLQLLRLGPGAYHGLQFLTHLTALQRLTLTTDHPNGTLDGLPPFILSLKALTHLRVSDAGVRSLPPAFAQLTALRDVDLAGCRLSAVPRPLLALPKLARLNLLGNAALDDEDGGQNAAPGALDALRGLTQLQELVAGGGLLTLGEGRWVTPQHGLERLQLHARSAAFSGQLVQLRGTLRRLEIHACSLYSRRQTALKEIAQLTGLEELTFESCNFWSHFSGLLSLQDFSQLTRLTRLEIVRTDVGAFTAGSFTNMPQLQVLRLSCNTHLRVMPPSLSELVSLRLLDLGGLLEADRVPDLAGCTQLEAVCMAELGRHWRRQFDARVLLGPLLTLWDALANLAWAAHLPRLQLIDLVDSPLADFLLCAPAPGAPGGWVAPLTTLLQQRKEAAARAASGASRKDWARLQVVVRPGERQLRYPWEEENEEY